MANQIDPSVLLEDFELGDFCFDGDTHLPCQHDNFEKLIGIGSGNFGSVSMYKHKETGSKLALKKQRFSLEEHPKMDRVVGLEEIKLLQKSTQCEFIVNFYGAYLYEGHIYIGEELMESSLLQVLEMATEKNILLPEPLLKKIGYSVCTALKFLLGINYMHRDIKPSNILLSSDGVFKLCDMGIAGDLIKGVDTQIGCKLYLPPERLTISHTAYTYKSDIWAVGMTMLELALGKHPYVKGKSDPTLFEIYGYALGSPPEPPTTRSEDLQLLISQCLQNDPLKRPDYTQLLQMAFLQSAELDSFVTIDWYKSLCEEHEQ
ncbi:Dual specificity mitogen-activated protein kinase kinase 6-like [Oopsacas minuta]|uniref:mitogen-activated protein kinase kinase n=1 Tax=Oopsacas minuta TaxID=111878 RepID=A0AAV7JCK1_9METZ|nr:Dual specificity mitogen-activated protein kinase kinase 6-like [Oopsacas minuta]